MKIVCKWRNLRSLVHVETQTTQLDSDEVRRQVRYSISSLPKKRRRAMLDLTYRDSLLSLA